VARGSYAKLWRQYFQYGFWKIRTMQKLKRVPTLRSVVPGLFITALGLGLLLAPWLWWPLALLMGSYGTFVLGGLFHGQKQTLLLRMRKALAIIILHLSYGLGQWAGLLHFGLGVSGIKSQTALSR